MRRVKLGSVSIKGIDFPVGKQLVSYLETSPQVRGGNGQDSATIRARFKVIDVIEKVADGEHVDLTDAQWQTLKACIEATTYSFGDRGLIELEDRVLTAPELGAS